MCLLSGWLFLPISRPVYCGGMQQMGMHADRLIVFCSMVETWHQTLIRDDLAHNFCSCSLLTTSGNVGRIVFVARNCWLLAGMPSFL